MRLAQLTAILLATIIFRRVSAAAAPATQPISQDEIERFIHPVVAGGWASALAVGILDDSGPRSFGYGNRTDDATSQRVTGDTVFEIGSASKVFTATLLARAVRDKKLTLEEPVAEALPKEWLIPKLGDKPVTLLSLATHTSGLPRMPDNFHPADPGNPYLDYSPEQLKAFLAGHKLRREPGETYEYSNVGTALLGQAIALQAQTTYEDLLLKRIAEPLKMDSTRITLNADLTARFAQGHDADGQPVAHWDLGVFEPAGGIRSTANDMLKFLAAQLALAHSELDDAIADTHVPHGRADAKNDICLGWHLDVTRHIFWHNGQTGGFHSYLAFDLKHRTAVVLLASSASGTIDDAGSRLLRRLSGDPSVEPPHLAIIAKVNPEALNEYAGKYTLAPGVIIDVTLENGRLLCQLTGQPRFGIYPRAADEFFWRVVDAQLSFQRDASHKIKGLVLHQNCRDLPASRQQ